MINQYLLYIVGAVICCSWISHTLAATIGLTPLPNGTIALTCTGAVEAVHSIQAATNLAAPMWVPIITTNADLNGAFGFIDRDATNYPCRYYRSAQLTAMPLGMAAKGQIGLSFASIDSYNSSIGPYSPANRGGNVVVLSNTNAAGAINLTGGYICGYAMIGSGGILAISSGGSVGDTNWITTSQGVQPGHVANNADFQFHDVQAPSLTNPYTAFATVGTTNVAGVAATTTYYQVPGISELSGQTLLINGNVTIYCTQIGNYSVNISGTGQIVITPGSSLILFVDAPEANFTFSGASRVCGALIANTINLSSSAGFHYDETLAGFLK